MEFVAGVPVATFDELDSTSAEAKRRAATGDAGPVWIVARRQTSGYGRRGDAWRSDEGDLMATRLFPLRRNDPPPAQLSFVSAIAMGDTIDSLAPGAGLQLKWPNDVLIDGAKVCGLLPELVSRPGADPIVALGVGLNIVSAPNLPDKATTRLADHLGAPPKPAVDLVLARLEAALAARLAEWRYGGFEPIRRAWTARAFGLGARARIVGAGAELQGVVTGLEPDGGLRLEHQGRIVIARAGSFVLD